MKLQFLSTKQGEGSKLQKNVHVESKVPLFRGGAMEKINSKRVGVLDTMVLPDNVNSAVKQGSR